MKRILAFVIVIVFAMSTIPLYAAPGGQKGASQKAMENASDEAVFHRIGDWFATVGKSDMEKKQILAQRKAERAAAKAQKKMDKAKKQADKEARKMKKTWGK